MRRLFAIMTLIVSMFAIACENDTPKDGKSDVTFKFSAIDATSNSVTYTVTPSDLDVNYFSFVVESATINGMSDADIINLAIDGLTVNKGEKRLTTNNLKADTAYSIIAYAINGTVVSQNPFFTQKTNSGDPTKFNVEIKLSNISSSTVTATATPNDNNVSYFFRVLTKMELDAFGIYNNDLEIFNYIIENPNSNSFIFKGAKTLEYDHLAPKTTYLAVAFNVDTYQDVVDGIIDIELFRKEFTTDDAAAVDPSTLFTYKNLTVDYTNFSLDVTPVQGDDKLWTYYVFEKKYFDEYREKGLQQVVMRAYFGLYNLCHEYNTLNGANLTFNEFINDYMGQLGTTTIINYEPLKPAKDYVVAMFYMDTEVYDPTVVYDYNFVAVEFTTSTPDDSQKVQMDVVGPQIEKVGFGYTISFNVAISNNAESLKYGAASWTDLVAQYYDPNDPASIRAFVNFKTATDDILSLAKTDEGATILYDTDQPFDGVFFFEAVNSQGALTQHMVRVTPDMF